ncbi:MAG: hypothetical protein GY944_04430 [bacterium]|nr:hypothetical protein [bacterium]
MELDEKVVKVAEALTHAGVPHSFGGAIALGYYAAPRQTYDIDINLYVSVEDEPQVMSAIIPLGVEGPDDVARRGLADSGQARLDWQGTPLDLFFSNLPFHESCMKRRQQEMFGDTRIDVLSPEDLMVCKVAFGRPKDRDDIRAMLEAIGGELDLQYVRSWVAEFLVPDDDRQRDLERAIAEHGL